MFGAGVRAILPALAAVALLTPQVATAQRWRDAYGDDAGYGADVPPPPPPPAYYARGYDAPPPPPGWYRAEYGPRGEAPPPRRYRCRPGTGGTILGAIAGGLLGDGIAGRGDRGAGTIIGAGVGALAGRAIDRDC